MTVLAPDDENQIIVIHVHRDCLDSELPSLTLLGRLVKKPKERFDEDFGDVTGVHAKIPIDLSSDKTRMNSVRRHART